MTVTMRWNSESYVFDGFEPDDFIYETSGSLHHVDDDDDDDEELAGRFRLYYVDIERAINEKVSTFDVLDAHSDHLAEYYQPIFASNAPDFSDLVLELLNHDVLGSNLLIIDRIELMPKFRGRRLGLDVMRHMIWRFSPGAAVVALKPFPLQFEVEPSDSTTRSWRAGLSLELFPKDEDIATNKLREYYSMLGFRRVGSTPFMVRSTAWPLPSVGST